MRQIVRVVGVVVAGGFAATAITPPAAASIDGNRFQVTTRTIAEYENDVGRKGPSIGDSFTITYDDIADPAAVEDSAESSGETEEDG